MSVFRRRLASGAHTLIALQFALVFAVRGRGDDQLANLQELVVRGLRDGDARALLETAMPGRLDERVKDRIIADPLEVVRRSPDIILGSWCGKKFVPAKVAARPGAQAIPAVRYGFLREIKSPLIRQPGPAALTDGLAALEGIIAEWAAQPRAA